MEHLITVFPWQFFLPVCNASWMMWEGPRFLSTFSAPWRYCNQLGWSGTSPRGECQLAGLTILLALLSGLKSSHSSTQTTQFRQLQNRKQSSKCVPGEEELQEGGQAGAQDGERTLPRVFQLLNCALPHTHSVSLVKSLGKHLWKQAYYDKSFIWLSWKGPRQHVSPSVTSITAASASENPDASQELRAQLQSFCGGPPKENSSLHPLHDIAGWT